MVSRGQCNEYPRPLISVSRPGCTQIHYQSIRMLSLLYTGNTSASTAWTRGHAVHREQEDIRPVSGKLQRRRCFYFHFSKKVPPLVSDPFLVTSGNITVYMLWNTASWKQTGPAGYCTHDSQYVWRSMREQNISMYKELSVYALLSTHLVFVLMSYLSLAQTCYRLYYVF